VISHLFAVKEPLHHQTPLPQPHTSWIMVSSSCHSVCTLDEALTGATVVCSTKSFGSSTRTPMKIINTHGYPLTGFRVVDGGTPIASSIAAAASRYMARMAIRWTGSFTSSQRRTWGGRDHP
jgi:hypothetical protein